MALYVVIGPPAAGKSTWVNERARSGDIVIDYDRIANALTAPGAAPHGHKRPLATVAFRAREGAITEALRHVKTHSVYIIHSVPKPQAMERYARHGAEVITVDPGRAVVEERCRAERPETYMDGVRRWYREAPRLRPRSASVAPVRDQQSGPRTAAGSRAW
ncbi:hypothetical protein [Streptomyces sp. NPDC059009]|uniref:hypothetical protein n=1 Tax=Streptomyces sp. NPDC059009 TaxID=3346694 RepID=UPI00369303CB